MKSAIKQALSTAIAMGMMVSILFGSLAFGLFGFGLLGNAQPAAAANMPLMGLNSSVLLANAGGRELRNSIDDKMATDYGNKIDVNNTNIASFRKFRGLYPTIAGKVVSNAPYESIDDILKIPGLSEVERGRLEQNIDIFSISAPDPALVEGADRFNNGVYK